MRELRAGQQAARSDRVGVNGIAIEGHLSKPGQVLREKGPFAQQL